MQPYFLPYIGYFQLIAAVDSFILYDNIEYTKKGWINRNRMLLNGKDAIFSLPLKKDSDYLDIVDRELALDFKRTKLLNQFKGAYSHAPHFELTYPILERIVLYEDDNLFGYINHSIVQLCKHLDIKTKISISSEININHKLKGQDKVLALCKVLGAQEYINTVGGTKLYCSEDFGALGINLKFIKSKPFVYNQFCLPFIPWLSIIDILMFNTVLMTKEYLTEFELFTRTKDV